KAAAEIAPQGQLRLSARGVVYSVCLEGFLFCKARYSQLRRWDSQLRQVFGSAVPSMADEKWTQLEQYLQNGKLGVFFLKDTFMIQTQRAFLDVYLTDGSNIRLEIQTLDTAERILEVTLCKMGLSRELIKYFSLFFFQEHDNGALSLVKKVAEFELPYVSLPSMKELYCKLGVRKWYMDPSLDTLLMDCTASLNLLYMQVKLKGLCNFEKGCSADIFISNNEIHCCIKLPTNQTKEVSYKINRLRSRQVTFLVSTSLILVLQRMVKKTLWSLDLSTITQSLSTWQWIILYTKQAFLLSSCLKKMVSEQMIKAAKEGQEMVSMSVCWCQNLYLKEISLLLKHSFTCAEKSPLRKRILHVPTFQ
uniref:Uncharacterized protein n=1 Tax=Melopsittacus undulatus TaxID=13146 RepID=A0A8C6IPX0_MELUD